MWKRTFWHVRPTKTQISLRIRKVWSEPSFSALWNIAPMAIQNVKILIKLSEFAHIRKYVFLTLRLILPFCNFLTIIIQWWKYKCISEGIQTMQQSWSTAFSRHQTKERWQTNQIMTKQISHMKSLTHRHRRTATGEPSWNSKSISLSQKVFIYNLLIEATSRKHTYIILTPTPAPQHTHTHSHTLTHTHLKPRFYIVKR